VRFPPRALWHPAVDFETGVASPAPGEWSPVLRLADAARLVYARVHAPDAAAERPRNADAARDLASDVAAFEARARAVAAGGGA